MTTVQYLAFADLHPRCHDDGNSGIHYIPKIFKIIYYSIDKLILRISKHLLRSFMQMLK